jgi:hypothetical protein
MANKQPNRGQSERQHGTTQTRGRRQMEWQNKRQSAENIWSNVLRMETPGSSTERHHQAVPSERVCASLESLLVGCLLLCKAAAVDAVVDHGVDPDRGMNCRYETSGIMLVIIPSPDQKGGWRGINRKGIDMENCITIKTHATCWLTEQSPGVDIVDCSSQGRRVKIQVRILGE